MPSKAELEAAQQDARERREDAAQAKLKAEERAENEAPRKAISDAVDYVKSKMKDVAESDFAKGVRNYGRLYKEGLGLKPETSYEKKKGGTVRSASARADGCAVRGKTRGKMY